MNFNISSKTKDLLLKINSDKCLIFNNSFVQIHVAQPTFPFIYSNISGLLCFLMIQEVPNKFFFRLFSPESLELLFEFELYYNFWKLNEANQTLKKNFFFFEAPQGFIGFLFNNEESSEVFKRIVKKNAPVMSESKLDQKLSEIQEKNNQKNKNENKTASITHNEENPIQYETNQKEGLDEIKNQFQLHSCSPNFHQEINSALIVKGKISCNQQKLNVNFEFDKLKNQFNLESLSPETKSLFKKSGIKKKELINPEIAPLLLEKFLKFVEENEKSNTKSENQISKNDKEKIEKVFLEKKKTLEGK